MRSFYLSRLFWSRLNKLWIDSYEVVIRRLFFSFLVFSFIGTSAAESCHPVNSAQIIFGNYSPEFSQDLDMDTTIDIYCAPAFQGQKLNAKINILDKAEQGGLRILQNTAGPDKAYFVLFQDSARTIPLINNMFIPVIESVPNSKIFTIRLYGRMLAKQNIGKGIYASNLIINIDY
jgi:spore coat protein U-like protein